MYNVTFGNISRSMLLSLVFHGLVFIGAGILVTENYQELQKELAPKGILLEMGAFTASAPDRGAGKIVQAPKVIPSSKYYHQKNNPHPEVAEENQASSTIGNSSITGAATGTVGDPNGAISVATEERYLYELKLLIEQNKQYPVQARMMGQTGKVIVRFLIAKDGTINNVEVAGASPYTKLNEAALKLIQNLKQFKPIPEVLSKDQWAITVPINYSLN